MRVSLFSIVILLYAIFSTACGSVPRHNSIANDPDDGAAAYARLGPYHSPAGWKGGVTFYVDTNAPEHVELAALSAADSWNNAASWQVLRYGGRSEAGRGDSLYSSLSDTQTVIYYEKSWAKTTGKDMQILATTVWENADNEHARIDRGDIILNAQFYRITDALDVDDDLSELKVVDAETVLVHEIGHLLGLSHFDEDENSVMNTYTTIGEGQSRRNLSDEDRKNIYEIYAPRS